MKKEGLYTLLGTLSFPIFLGQESNRLFHNSYIFKNKYSIFLAERLLGLS